MKIKMSCGIGYINAEHHDEIEIDDEELKGKTEDEIEEYIYEEYVMPFANEHLEAWYTVIVPRDSEV